MRRVLRRRELVLSFFSMDKKTFRAAPKETGSCNTSRSTRKNHRDPETEKRVKDADLCTGLGVGVGALGGTAAALGAVCPICFVVAPALVGVGLIERHRVSKKRKQDKSKDSGQVRKRQQA